MQRILTPSQQQWVERTLNSLSLEQAIGQLFNISRPIDDADTWLRLLEKFPAGAFSARTKTAEAYKTLLTELQKNLPVPLLVIANMEHGASEWPDYGTDFPMPMAAGAANDEALIAQLGQATASRSTPHWYSLGTDTLCRSQLQLQQPRHQHSCPGRQTRFGRSPGFRADPVAADAWRCRNCQTFPRRWHGRP